MSANVETMFSVREVPWHGIGTIVREALNSKDALIAAGLDWKVQSKPIFDESGNEIEGFKSNVRSSDNSILGIVSDRYKIVQNEEAFSFTDNLIGGGNAYETAGSLRNGKQIWLLCKTPSKQVLGDQVDPYICFTNSHDGMGSIRVCMTPVRVVCNNTLNLALQRASRSWNTRHIGDINSKVIEAQRTLELAGEYMDDLASTAEKLANASLTDDQVRQIIDELFPIPDDSTDRVKKNVEDIREGFMVCYLAPDIAKFKNTAWGVVNAASDFATHSTPKRVTANSQANRWGNLLNGNVIIDTTFLRMCQMAGINKK